MKNFPHSLSLFLFLFLIWVVFSGYLEPFFLFIDGIDLNFFRSSQKLANWHASYRKAIQYN